MQGLQRERAHENRRFGKRLRRRKIDRSFISLKLPRKTLSLLQDGFFNPRESATRLEKIGKQTTPAVVLWTQ